MREPSNMSTKDAIVAAIEILAKNESRDLRNPGFGRGDGGGGGSVQSKGSRGTFETDDDADREDSEKFCLSKAAVDWLLACSSVPTLRNQFLTKRFNALAIQALRDADICSRHTLTPLHQRGCEAYHRIHEKATNPGEVVALKVRMLARNHEIARPIMIERTALGTQVMTLLLAVATAPTQATDGTNEPMSPNGVVAARLLRRIGDELMGAPELHIVELQNVLRGAEDHYAHVAVQAMLEDDAVDDGHTMQPGGWSGGALGDDGGDDAMRSFDRLHKGSILAFRNFRIFVRILAHLRTHELNCVRSFFLTYLYTYTTTSLLAYFLVKTQSSTR